MKVYFEHIYERVGYLFYAVASEKGKLNKVTLRKLLQIIDHQWKSSSNGTGAYTLQSHLVDYLLSGIRNAVDNSLSSGQAFDYFQSYYEIHSIPFGIELQAKIMSTANVIAHEFSENGTASDMVRRLETLFHFKSIFLQ